MSIRCLMNSGSYSATPTASKNRCNGGGNWNELDEIIEFSSTT